MEFRVLGQLQLLHGGDTVHLGGAGKPRLLLAILLAHRGQTVTVDTLVGGLWGVRPPASARRNVHQYVYRLRHALGAQRLPTRPGGYAVVLGEGDTLDADEFWRLADTDLKRALDLWRGNAFAEFAEHELIGLEAGRLERKRETAYEQWLEMEIEAGRHLDLLPILPGIVGRYPYNENLLACYMTALARGGRQAEALQVFRDGRAILAEQLGIEPGPLLQRHHLAILRGEDPRPDRRGRQFLPHDIPDFTGRQAELEWLDSSSRGRAPAGTILINAIAGIGGAGKTALAVRWAHSAAHRYPDGQLYINLRGYDPGRPMPVIEALGQLLRALEVGPSQIPSEVDEAAALYRATMADRKVLVLLDNAGSVEQVRPLLPSGRDNLVLVTSRDRLGGLVARDGARRLTLDTLPEREAVALLRQLLGAERVAAEPGATATLVTATGRLPLALRIAAANLSDRPHQTIAEYVGELSGPDPLSALSIEGDPQSTLRTVFHHSYRILGPDQQRLFRLLGLIPGPDFTLGATAALTGLPEARCRELLTQLEQAHLIGEHRPGRYLMHDLIRLYARQLTPSGDVSAISGLFMWYLRVASDADSVLRPYRALTFSVEEAPGPQVTFGSEAEALAWFDTEAANLAAAVTAAEAARPDLCWRLACVMYSWVERRHRLADWLHLFTAGARAAAAIQDRAGEATMRSSLVPCLYMLDRFDEAIEHGEWAARERRRIGDPLPLANTLTNLGSMYAETGRDAEAIAHLEEAARLADTGGGAAGSRAINLHNLAWAHWLAGRLKEAAECNRRAAVLAAEGGDYQTVSHIEANLASIHARQGDHQLALHHWELAAQAASVSDNQRLRADALAGMGRHRLELGEQDLAVPLLRDAIEIYRSVDGEREAGQLTGLLESLGRSAHRAGISGK